MLDQKLKTTQKASSECGGLNFFDESFYVCIL